jgi:hypothetical protein
MPPFHLVPMFFSSLRVRSRPATFTLTDPLVDVQEKDEEDDECDDVLTLLEKYRNVDLDNLSSTEEDGDESLEDWWQQQQLTPTTTTTTLSSPDALTAYTTVPCHAPNHAAIFDSLRRTGDDVESVASRVSLERMRVIPFVSLHLEQPAALLTTKSGDESSVPTSDAGEEQSFHWNLMFSRALDRDQNSYVSVERQQRETQTARRTDLSPTPSTVASPSSCSSGRMKTIPLQSILGNANREAAHTLSLGHHSSLHFGPAIPTVVSLHLNSCQDADPSGGILWDPARPLLFGDTAKDALDWKSHALDVQSSFSESCLDALALLASNRRDDRVLSLVRRTPELCLVRFRVHHSTELLLHWCCRQLWLEGVLQCYRATPEVIGMALDCMLPLHVAVVAAGDAPDDPGDVVEFLCQRYPEALRQTNQKLQTPLHLAVSAPYLNEAAIQLLLEGYPTAAMLADEHGWTPAHYVCRARRPDGSAARVLSLILRHAPSSADAVTRNLEKPIHIAAKNDADDLIQIFLEIETSSFHITADDATDRDSA